MYLEEHDYVEETPSQESSERWAWTPRTKTRDEKLYESFKKRGISTSNISPQLATQQTSRQRETEDYHEYTRERPRSSQEAHRRSHTTGDLDTKLGASTMNYSYPADYPIQPRVVRPQGEKIATLSKGGRMEDYIGTKSEHLSYPKDYPIHPRVVKPEAREIAELSKGKRMKRLIHEYGHLTPSPRPVPRIKPEAEDIAEGHRGKPVAMLLGSYGKLGPPTRRVQRIKPEARQAYEPHRGKRMARIIKQQRTGRSARSDSSMNNLRLDLEKLNTRDDYEDPFSSNKRPKSRDDTRSESFHRRNNTTWW
ncbi:uncharacterized protein LOC106155590 [Lingula anatina]|uniref:Uncharacterized protein LOC106155590 n=1 Tax=Lingula anatina TaxID=7574 RepID=A0A1S3HIK9_LINAN|nr:uncharacterized protein LOC106155590 [Lingula anatina]|eukprot:XP_013385938.1 uncharacterized protein LOC106155590 [Lingula anatina]